ncbi:hypothetical protein LPTSP4_09440 [Leptospira ryugenii]|uniref:Uncharacterized protein n=1 Tax=Leptospira ryugenii TaxID=1917863 RepID=A0A2P2DXT0_9LEPT|nr:hypothetical protein [Leptospira ryugenii]GBF49431.1 hypothetical protein LPTSP4_09440 [Leptospira ryugenii]
MYKLRFKTKNIDVLIRYTKSTQPRGRGQFEDLYDGKIIFKIKFPYLSDYLLRKFEEKLYIEFDEEGNHLYFASSPQVILPTRNGGRFESKFVHPTYLDDITYNLRSYVKILTDLDFLIKEAFWEKDASEISF